MDPTILGAVIGGVLATIGGVLGGIVTGWFTLMANKQSLDHEAKREERERSLGFRQEQLSQFYGPVWPVWKNWKKAGNFCLRPIRM